MKPDLDDALVREFPMLYRDRHGDTRRTRMCDGFACGDGWEPLIRRASEKLEPLVRGTCARAFQVKEKFGTLRFYMDSVEPLAPDVDEAIAAAIEAAEEESARTCEECGGPGELRDARGWFSTLCARCFDERERERARREQEP